MDWILKNSPWTILSWLIFLTRVLIFHDFSKSSPVHSTQRIALCQSRDQPVFKAKVYKWKCCQCSLDWYSQKKNGTWKSLDTKHKQSSSKPTFFWVPCQFSGVYCWCFRNFGSNATMLSLVVNIPPPKTHAPSWYIAQLSQGHRWSNTFWMS